MSALYLEAFGGIAASLSVLMARAWVVQRRAGNSGSVGIWPFSLGRVGVGSPLWPVGGAPSNAGKGAVATAGVYQPVVPAAAAGLIPTRTGRVSAK